MACRIFNCILAQSSFEKFYRLHVKGIFIIVKFNFVFVIRKQGSLSPLEHICKSPCNLQTIGDQNNFCFIVMNAKFKLIMISIPVTWSR